LHDLDPPAPVDDLEIAYDATPCGVEAFGVVQVPLGEIAGLRKTLGPASGRAIAPSLLKHADHQTVIALASILKAVDDFGWRDQSFEDWGIIAAPRFLGRLNSAVALLRFWSAGAPGVSPLIVPTLCLHAVAGALSLAMKCHGFNYGVGGGHGHLGDALLTGLAARDDDNVPGVWIVTTQFDPEPRPGPTGACSNEPIGYAVALAIRSNTAAQCRLNLRLLPRPAPGLHLDADVDVAEPDWGLIQLADFLKDGANSRKIRRWYCPIAGVGTIQLDDDPARASSGVDRPVDVARAG
jgi:hypothetical protein